MTEKCGIFGAFGEGFEAARVTYYGLWSLQHRGQEASGISVTNGKRIKTPRGEGLVAHVYKEEDLYLLEGFGAIGHNRYGTSGGKGGAHAQPVIGRNGTVAVAHNGNLPSVKKLVEFLASKKIATDGDNDSELMQKAIAYYLHQEKLIEEAVRLCFPLFTGAFCLVILVKDKLIALRDSYGIRPLSLGKLDGGYVVASETCAIDTVNGTFIREIKPGEMVVIDKKGVRSYQLAKGQQKLDIFEYIYFARPDSMLLGRSINEVRKGFGRELSREFADLQADVVIPVPDSAVPAALGFAVESGIPFDHGFVKNRYIHRTFIRPDQKLRMRDVKLKLHPLAAVLKGKRVVVVDDSIVRGTTSKELVSMLRRAGAVQVHMLVSSPPVKYPDFYGIDTPAQKDLIASRLSVEEIRRYIGSDSLYYLSFAGMLRAIGLSAEFFSLACLNGEYPIDILERGREVERIS